MSKEKTYYDYWNNTFPICPYCDKNVLDAYEYNLEDDETESIECGNCGKHFGVTCHTTTEYQTLGDCKKNGDMPHKFKKKGFESSPHECENCHKEFYDFHLHDGQFPKLKEDEYVLFVTPPASIKKAP